MKKFNYESKYENNQFKKIISKDIRIITSKLAGEGKSRFIEVAIQKEEYKYVRIPIYGNLSKRNLIELLKTKINYSDNYNEENIKRIAYHFDVYESNLNLNFLFFEILILKVINDCDKNFFIFSKNAIFYIEIANTLKTN